MEYLTIFGSPGTGKTSFCKEVSSDLIQRGAAAKEEIAYVAFGKKAAAEAAERCGVTAEEYRKLWYRTLHSACYRLLGLNHGSVVTSAKLKEFSKRFGVELDRDLSVEGDEMADLAEVMLAIKRNRVGEEPGSEPSRLLSLFHLSRLLSRTESELGICRGQPHPQAYSLIRGNINLTQYRALVRHYETWKTAEGLNDFTDMLERVLTEPIALPPWKYAFVDEAQDMGALQFCVVDKIFRNVETLFLAGDDEQAIYNFTGSSARDFLAYRNRGRKIHLNQTHRFGARIVQMGREIAGRLSEREPKDILPADVENEVRLVYGFNPKNHPGKKFLLHRHVRGCAVLARKMIEAGVPFWNERGLNPLSRSAEIGAFVALSKLSRGESVRGDDVVSLLHLLPSYKETEDRRIQLVKHGSKKKLLQTEPSRLISAGDLKEHLLSPVWKAISEKDFGIASIEFPDYYARLEKSGWNPFSRDEPDTIITTIHGSKGRERQNVALWNEVLPRCMKDENEHRVAYVGATRTKGSLYIVHENLTGWQTTQYPYPMSQPVTEEV
jgi:superfamily I DNA/RNA helicase